MTTEVYRLSPEDIDSGIIQKAGEVIRRGGLVAFPTETVYGLGGDALNSEASKKIYAAKGRPSDNPLIVHIAEEDALIPLVREVPEKGRLLMHAFWPGPLTLIFRKTEMVPPETSGGLPTVAVRMPVDPIAAALIRASGGYIAAPSANSSGRPSPTTAEHVVRDLDGRVVHVQEFEGLGVRDTVLVVFPVEEMGVRPGAAPFEQVPALAGEGLVLHRERHPFTGQEGPHIPELHLGIRAEVVDVHRVVLRAFHDAVLVAVPALIDPGEGEGFPDLRPMLCEEWGIPAELPLAVGLHDAAHLPVRGGRVAIGSLG